MLGLVAWNEGATFAKGQGALGLAVGVAGFEVVDKSQAAGQVQTVVVGMSRKRRIQRGQRPVRMPDVHEDTRQLEGGGGIIRRGHELRLKLRDALARGRILGHGRFDFHIRPGQENRDSEKK